MRVLGITSARIDEYTKVGDVQQINGRNSTRVTVTMYHEKLHEHKSLSSPDIYTLKEKIKTQAYKWSEKWQAVEKKQQAALIKQRSMTEKENAIEEARRRTIEAAESFEQLDNILMDSITINNVLDWESLKRKDKFPEIPPQKSQKQRRLDYPQKPDRESAEFTPSLNFFQKLIGSMREKKIQEFEEKYKQAISLWYKQTTEIDSVNQKNEKDYNDMLKKWENAILEHESLLQNQFLNGLFTARNTVQSRSCKSLRDCRGGSSWPITSKTATGISSFFFLPT